MAINCRTYNARPEIKLATNKQKIENEVVFLAQIDLENSPALHEFQKVIFNVTTKKHYMAHLRRYQAYTNLSFDELANRPIEIIQPELENYLELLQNEQGHHKSYIRLAFAGINLFYIMNNKVVNKIRLSKMIRPDEFHHDLKPYTTNDIVELLDNISFNKLKKHPRFALTRLRLKTAIFFLSASGCRIGGMTNCKVRDLAKMPDGCYSVKVDANTKQQYFTFLTKQASLILDEWLQFYKTRFGKEPTNDEFLNYPLFDLDHNSMYSSIARLVRKTKQAHPMPDTVIHHSFRYRFNTILKSNKEVNPILAERLMGHNTIALDEHYLKPSIESLYTEYKKASKDLEIV